MTDNVKPQLEFGRYRHFKGGEYEVTELRIDVTNGAKGKWTVLYQSVGSEALKCVRSYDEFVESVQIGDESVPRFMKIDE